ncbi:MAG TPA: universal stress protein [Solirubrobacteraceae bacterium]
MGCYRTILVGIDGSRDAAAALMHAASLARDQHAKLILLTVMPPPPPQVASPGALPTPPSDGDEVFAQILREAVETLPPDIGVQTRLARGRPARRILETARETDCDLVVLGFHGHGRLHHALAGSTSDSVLRASCLPVLLMRAAAQPAPRAPGPPPDSAPDEARAATA